MLKTYIAAENGERFALYCNIPAVYGGYVLETGGEPTCLNELEQAGDCETVVAVCALISAPSTVWMNCDESDKEYISATLKAWGIA